MKKAAIALGVVLAATALGFGIRHKQTRRTVQS